MSVYENPGQECLFQFGRDNDPLRQTLVGELSTHSTVFTPILDFLGDGGTQPAFAQIELLHQIPSTASYVRVDLLGDCG